MTDWLTLIHLLEVPEERKHLILIECWLWYLTRVQQQWKWKYPLEHTTITTKQTGVPAKIRIDFTTRGRSIIKPSAARRRNFWWNKPLSEFHTSSLSLSQTEKADTFPSEPSSQFNMRLLSILGTVLALLPHLIQGELNIHIHTSPRMALRNCNRLSIYRILND